MACIEFRSKRLKHLSLKVYGHSNFQKILHLIHEIDFLFDRETNRKIAYALAELLANGQRAHQQHYEESPIILSIRCDDGQMTLEITDMGRGFNPQKLPYDINAPKLSVDPLNDEFQSYREKNGNKRFGLGMLIAKRTFDTMEVEFLDPRGNVIPWTHGLVMGTKIRLAMKRKK